MIDVTVVIPTRDRCGLLATTLTSALAQVDVALEVVVVDDGSVDATSDFLDGLATHRIQVVRHEKSRGVAASRNSGIKVASGRWIAFLDDDDLWAPWKLATQLATAHEREARWVYGGAVEVGRDGVVYKVASPPEPCEVVRTLQKRNLVPAGSSNVLVRADLLDQAGAFDEGLRHLADWELWLRLAQVECPAVVRAPVVAYRQHDGQATLDTRGMSAEARVLASRHGIDRAAVHRWAAWSHLRSGRRPAAVLSCLAAVAAGDVTSLGRGLIVAVAPHPTGLQSQLRQRGGDSGLLKYEAQRWVTRALSQPSTAPDRPSAGQR